MRHSSEFHPSYDRYHTIAAPSEKAHIIVFGNEKGGSGKSTSAMHVAIALLRMGYKVGTIDLDARQGTLTRYMRNRFEFIKKYRDTMISPFHMAIEKSGADTVAQQRAEDRNFLYMAIDELGAVCDFIIVDTPGTDSFLSRLAHAQADTLVTPMNDSFVDLALLADLDMDDYSFKSSSVYADMVYDARMAKSRRSGKPFDWVVMRNRLSHLSAKNKMNMEGALSDLSKHLDFKIASGFGERVIFRELFLKGITLLDLKEEPGHDMTMSHVTARQEVRALIHALDPEKHKALPDT